MAGLTFASTTETPEALKLAAEKFGEVATETEQPKDAPAEVQPADAPEKPEGDEPKKDAATEPAEQQGEQRPPKTRKDPVQARIDKMHAKSQIEITRERERADRLEREIEELRGKKAEPVEPKAENFATDEEYDEAVADWRTRKVLREEQEGKERAAIETAERERHETLLKDYEAGAKEGETEYDDWEETMMEGKNVQLTAGPFAHTMITELGKDGPKMAYYLVKHPEAVELLNKQTTKSGFVLTLGRLAEKMVAQRQDPETPKSSETPKTPAVAAAKPPAAKTKTITSSAPAPVAPLTAGGPATADGRPTAQQILDDPGSWTRWKRKQAQSG